MAINKKIDIMLDWFEENPGDPITTVFLHLLMWASIALFLMMVFK